MAKIVSEKKQAAPARKKTASKSETPNNLREVEKLAYQFFVERGHKHGHDREDWLRAEAIVNSRSQS